MNPMIMPTNPKSINKARLNLIRLDRVHCMLGNRNLIIRSTKELWGKKILKIFKTRIKKRPQIRYTIKPNCHAENLAKNFFHSIVDDYILTINKSFANPISLWSSCGMRRILACLWLLNGSLPLVLRTPGQSLMCALQGCAGNLFSGEC